MKNTSKYFKTIFCFVFTLLTTILINFVWICTYNVAYVTHSAFFQFSNFMILNLDERCKLCDL